jgi:hypothetical protein
LFVGGFEPPGASAGPANGCSAETGIARDEYRDGASGLDGGLSPIAEASGIESATVGGAAGGCVGGSVLGGDDCGVDASAELASGDAESRNGFGLSLPRWALAIVIHPSTTRLPSTPKRIKRTFIAIPR